MEHHLIEIFAEIFSPHSDLAITYYICCFVSVGEPCELPYFELDGEILNPGANQPYYFPSDREYQMSCNEGFVIQLGEGESYLWTCVKGNWTTTAECVGTYQCNQLRLVKS